MSEHNQYFLNSEQIRKFLPHRSPFLLVDRILEIHPAGDVNAPPPSADVGTRVLGLKNVSYNEPYFQGHFPEYAIVPGVLLLETMAQVSSFSIYPSMGKDVERLAKGFQCILVGVDSARFRRPVVPGDTLLVKSEVKKSRGNMWVFDCEITVDSKKVAQAEIIANMVAAIQPQG